MDDNNQYVPQGVNPPEQQYNQNSQNAMPPQSTHYQPQRLANNPGETLGIASLVLGICGIVMIPIFPSIAGIICGVSGRSRSRSVGAPYGLAKAGIIISICGICVWVMLIVFIIAMVVRAVDIDSGIDTLGLYDWTMDEWDF